MFEKIFLKPEKFTVILGLVFGLLLLFFNPPFQAPDEDAHLFKMWSMLDGNFTFDVYRGQRGHIIPLSLAKMAEQNEPMKFNLGVRLNIKGFSYLKNIKLNKEKKVFYNQTPTGYTIISYIPAIFVLAVLKFFNVNPLYMIYILRFCCLLVYLALIYNAIKITPCHKWLFAFLALIPSGIYIAGAINTDCLVIGLGFLLIAYTLKLKFDKAITQISNKQLLFWGILFTLLCTMKYLYLPFILLYLLLPKDKFSIPAKYYNVMFIIALINIIYNIYFIWNILHFADLGLDRYNDGSASKFETMKFILEHPVQLIHNFIIVHSQTINKLLMLFVAQFGWSPVGIELLYVIIYFLLIGGSIFYQNDIGISINIKDKLIMFAVVLFSYCFILLSIFMLYRNYDAMQARYALPYIPLLFLVFTTNKINFSNKVFYFISIIALVLVYINCCKILTDRFYIFPYTG